jgi:hypothetical protein
MLILGLFGGFASGSYSKSADWNIVRRSQHQLPTIILPKQQVSLPLPPKSAFTPESFIPSVTVVANDLRQNVLLLPEATELLTPAIATIGNTAECVYAAAVNSIPIRDARMTITIGLTRQNIVAVRNSIPNFSADVTAPIVPPQLLFEKTLAEIGNVSQIISSPSLVYVADSKIERLRLCYELRVRDVGSESWRLTFDASDGELIEKKLLTHQVTGTIKAKVHLRTPFDTLTTVSLPFATTTNGTLSVEADSNGHFQIPTAGANLTTTLTSKYMGVINTGSASASVNSALPLTAQTILFDDNNSNAAERDAYYSVNWARLFIHNIDTGLTRLDEFLKVNVNVNSSCNAFYDPSVHSLNFFSAGSGCQNTAEIADVVYHEFGHRIQHAVYSTVVGGDTDIVNGSLGEGFSDIYASFMRDDPRIGVDFFGNNNQLLRNCDNKNIWPDSLSLDPHFNGEVISGAFWDLRKSIGLPLATKLFHRMMYHTPDAPEIFSDDGLLEAFLQTLAATIIADDDDNNLKNGTPHIQQILAAFAKHRVTLNGFLHFDVPHIPDQDTGSIPYPFSSSITYDGPVGDIDTSSVVLYYSVNGENVYHPIGLTFKNSSFTGYIPSQKPGSTVRYYVSCKLNISGDSVIFPVQPYSFLVGYKRVFFDDCEQPNGWKTRLSSDNATTGLWELAKPYGTFTNPQPPLFFVQQDTDHTPNGTMCYVTGNRNGLPASLTRDPSFDDVDNGSTTLTTPVVHFDSAADPIIRYWYYYSNDQGNNPGIPRWVVKMSADSGITWKTVINSNVSTDGWTLQSLRVRDYEVPTHTVSLQFIASDNVGALVEAGIDDYEVLDVIPLGNHSGSVRTGTPVLASFPYPNPVVAGNRVIIEHEAGSLELYDVLGKKIAASDNGSIVIAQSTSEGVYLLYASEPEGEVHTYRIVVTR